MKIWLILKTSLRNLSVNKLRTFLTLLGIIIGVSTVLMMISVGNSAASAVTSTIKGLGSNLIFVFNLHNVSETLQINESDLYAIARLPHVMKAIPQVNVIASANYMSESLDVSVAGTYPEFEEMRNFHPLMGRFIRHEDVASSAKVAVIGYSVYEKFFSGTNPLGKVIKLNNVPFKVVGVVGKKGSQSLGFNPDEMVIAPITTVQQRFIGTGRIDVISIEADSESSVQQVSSDVKELLKRRRNLKSEDEEFFRILTQEEIISTASQITNILTVLLAGIASISLLVGGIGIMNIMLVTVTERTREIGIRKAVGARKVDILIQFLFESVILCSFGGLIGIMLGYAGSIAIARFGGWTPVVYPSTVALSFGFAVTIGIFFGLYPAYKAASLNPIEALRYE